jgi:hypothetical protein
MTVLNVTYLTDRLSSHPDRLAQLLIQETQENIFSVNLRLHSYLCCVNILQPKYILLTV